MKKITYRIFIYICLTTIIANTSASEPHKKCESSINEVVKQYLQTYAKGNKKCDPVDETTSKFDGTIDPHLCATIRDTVIEICKLNATLDLTLQEFKPQMAKLRTEVENVSKIVAELNESISNPVYKERINAIPNFQSIAMLNDHLGPKGQFICGSIDDPYNPLCLILLWTNRALVDTIIPPSKNATVDTVVTKKPSLPKNSTTKAVAHASEEHKPKENPPSAVGGAKDPSKEQKVVVQQTNIHDEASRVGNVTQSQVPKTEDPKQTAKLQETKSSQQQKPVGKADSISSQTNEKLGEIAQPGNTADKVPKQDVKKEKSKEEVKPTTQKPVTISEDTDNDQTEFEPPRDRGKYFYSRSSDRLIHYQRRIFIESIVFQFPKTSKRRKKYPSNRTTRVTMVYIFLYSNLM